MLARADSGLVAWSRARCRSAAVVPGDRRTKV